MLTMRLAGKVVIVTGAGSGFGVGIAERMAAEGGRMVLGDINAQGAKQTADSIVKAGGQAHAVRADVATNDGWKSLCSAAQDQFGRIDVVVNNAGWTHRLMPLLEMSEEDYDRVFDINVKSIFLSARHVVPIMRLQDRPGNFIQIGSSLGVRPRPGLTPYNASKSAVMAMTKSLALEFAPDRIRFNAINPAFAMTGLAANFMGGNESQEMHDKFLATVPLGRLCTPRDIANAAVFLASDDADYITGSILQVDGGRTV